jgi:hypothetical protein
MTDITYLVRRSNLQRIKDEVTRGQQAAVFRTDISASWIKTTEHTAYMILRKLYVIAELIYSESLLQACSRRRHY